MTDDPFRTAHYEDLGMYAGTAGRLLARAEVETRRYLEVRRSAESLPWWAWLRRRALLAIAESHRRYAFALVAASENADER